MSCEESYVYSDYGVSIVPLFSSSTIKSIANRYKTYKDEQIDNFELQEFKRQRLLDKEFWELVKEITSFSVFLCFLFVVAYSNLSASAIHFNHLFQNTFIYKQSNVEIGLDNVNSFLVTYFKIFWVITF